MSRRKPKTRGPVAMLSLSEDLPLLMFLWRWKVSTTAVLSRKFYSHRSGQAAYLRLWKLEKAGFIRSISNNTANMFIWTLDRRGFESIRPHLPDLKEEGYSSENIFHDLLVAAIHQGDCIFKKLSGVDFVTEQELRRLNQPSLPGWVPECDRRPDGYWRVRNDSSHKVVALEVELSPKVESEYDSIARYYEERDGIDQILWVVRRESVAEKMFEVMQNATRRKFKHSLIGLDPLYSSGWQAAIHCGLDAGKTVNQVLQNQPLKGLKPVLGQFSLDTRKTPHKSKPCEVFRPPNFSY